MVNKTLNKQRIVQRLNAPLAYERKNENSQNSHCLQNAVVWSDSAKFCDFGFISQDLQNFDTLFLIWQNIKPILANLLHCWLIFIVPNGPILNYNLTIRSNVGLKTHVQTEQKCESLLCHLISVFELPSKFFYRNEHCIAFKNPQQGSKRMCKLR